MCRYRFDVTRAATARAALAALAALAVLDKPGRSADEPNPAGTMLQTVSFEALSDARTRLTIRTRMVSAEILASMQRIGMTEGWSESLDRLGAEMQRMAVQAADAASRSGV